MCLSKAPQARKWGDATHLACIRQSGSIILPHHVFYLDATWPSLLLVTRISVSKWEVAYFVPPRLCIGACIPTTFWNGDPICATALRAKCRFQPHAEWAIAPAWTCSLSHCNRKTMEISKMSLILSDPTASSVTYNCPSSLFAATNLREEGSVLEAVSRVRFSRRKISAPLRCRASSSIFTQIQRWIR